MEDLTGLDPRILPILIELRGLPLIEHEGEVFEDQTVFLDGHSFSNCQFVNCRMVVAFGCFAMLGKCSFRRGGWVLMQPVEGAVKFLEYVKTAANLPRAES